MRYVTGFVVAMAMLLASPALAGSLFLQCAQSELKDPGCNTVSINTTPLHFTASCQECEGGGSEPKCTPGEKISPQTLAVDNASDHQPVPGTFSQAMTCDFGVILWKFSGSLTKGQTYNVVANITGHPKTLLLTFTAGASTPAIDLGGLPPTDGGGSTTGDGGGSTTGDGGSTTGDGGNTGGSDEEGCSCRVATAPAARLPLAALLLLALVLGRRRR